MKATAPAPVGDGKRGMKADAATERALKTWKAAYLEAKKAELRVQLARSAVKGLFDQHGVDYFTSSLGTIPLQYRAGRVTTDWEALARALVPKDQLEASVETFTTCSEGTTILAAPAGWSAEAGC